MENLEPPVSQQFQARIQRAGEALRALSPEQVTAASPSGEWSRKQELGHLLDSAQNNHQRIVVAALHGGYEGPTYAQNEWVDLHGYDDMSWDELLLHWSTRNQLLGRVIARISKERLSVPVTIGTDSAMPLEAWIIDYLQHLEHHVEHITSTI